MFLFFQLLFIINALPLKIFRCCLHETLKTNNFQKAKLTDAHHVCNICAQTSATVCVCVYGPYVTHTHTHTHKLSSLSSLKYHSNDGYTHTNFSLPPDDKVAQLIGFLRTEQHRYCFDKGNAI